MKINHFFKLTRMVCFCILLFVLNGCNGQSENNDSCLLHLKNARNQIASYYKTNEQSLLLSSIDECEKSMPCLETRKAAIELKVGLIIKLKRFQEGQKYVDSLTESDFKLKYKKRMWHNYFIALEFDSKGDTVKRNNYYKEIVSDIQNYIFKDSLPAGEINEESYYDLLFAKSKFLNKKEVYDEIEVLIHRYPKEQQFFDGVKTSLYKVSFSSNASEN